MNNLKIMELTKENENLYLDKLVELEKIVLHNMEKNGKSGQLFITGKEDISEYIHSIDNTVMIAINDKDDVISSAYITQGQIPFTYNDITKYFKYGKEYQEYVRTGYKNEADYRNDMLDIYKIKLLAYKNAKEKIMEEYPEYCGDILSFLERELSDKSNKFHEKSELREKLNKYMSLYILEKNENLIEKYEKFYWITSEDVANEFSKKINPNKDMLEYESWMKEEQEEYKKIMKESKLKIFESSGFDKEKYYKANTKSAVEIDTYITHPLQRSEGTARILVYEGIKKHIKRHFRVPENKEIYLCSTLHRDNLSSKYVSEFFGLKDNLYLNRRNGRNREVHICKIDKEEIKNYLEKMEDKLIVLYNYNPNNKKLSQERKNSIIMEQLKYEECELDRLKRIRKSDISYAGKKLENKSKMEKIKALKKQIKFNKEKGEANYER